MRAWRALALLALLVPARAGALTADGAMLTQAATVSFHSMGGMGVGFTMSYLATGNVVVCNPMLSYEKTATPTLAVPSGTVTFTLWAINNSITTSALNVVLSEMLPDNMSYVSPYESWASGLTASYATGLAGPWMAGEMALGQASPMYMRWTISLIGVGPGTSAYVAFRGRVL